MHRISFWQPTWKLMHNWKQNNWVSPFFLFFQIPKIMIWKFKNYTIGRRVTFWKRTLDEVMTLILLTLENNSCFILKIVHWNRTWWLSKNCFNQCNICLIWFGFLKGTFQSISIKGKRKRFLYTRKYRRSDPKYVSIFFSKEIQGDYKDWAFLLQYYSENYLYQCSWNHCIFFCLIFAFGFYHKNESWLEKCIGKK